MLLIFFFLSLRVGVGRHRGGKANDGNFQNDSMLLQGAVLMGDPQFRWTRCNLQKGSVIETGLQAASAEQAFL